MILDSAICLADSFEFTIHHCMRLKAPRQKGVSLNRIAADKSHRVIVFLLMLLVVKETYETENTYTLALTRKNNCCSMLRQKSSQITIVVRHMSTVVRQNHNAERQKLSAIR